MLYNIKSVKFIYKKIYIIIYNIKKIEKYFNIQELIFDKLYI